MEPDSWCRLVLSSEFIVQGKNKKRLKSMRTVPILTVTAEKMFEKSIKVSPEYALGYFNLGIFYIRNKENVDLGLRYVLKALELEPLNLEYLSELAGIYRSLGQMDKVFEVMNRIGGIDPYYVLRGEVRL